MTAAPMWPGFVAAAPSTRYYATILSGLLSGAPLPADGDRLPWGRGQRSGVEQARWSGVTVAVLVADGGAGPAWMHSAADTLARVLPDAVRRTLPGQDRGAAPDVLAPCWPRSSRPHEQRSSLWRDAASVQWQCISSSLNGYV